MTNVDQKDAHQRLIDGYFETTSQQSRETDASFENTAQGLARGLSSWMDVEGKSVLDLGSGTGTMCWLAQRAGASRLCA